MVREICVSLSSDLKYCFGLQRAYQKKVLKIIFKSVDKTPVLLAIKGDSF